MSQLFKNYMRDRLFEWVMTCAMLGLALELMLWPASIGASSFHMILAVISSEYMAMVFLAFGLLRVVALIANGRWPAHGPRLRAMGAGVAAIMWGQMFMALLLIVSQRRGIPSPGIPIYFSLMIGELISSYRAMSDERPSCR